MNNSIISILIPVYNVEQYLPRCIESVLTQDFQDWEMILVDDGSPDKCPQICDEYAKKDKRIRVVHKVNGGLVSARLAGFEASVGKYLMFLDSDDYLLPDALSILYNKIEEGYDLVRGMNYRVSSSGKIKGLEKVKFYKGVLTGEEYRKKYVQGDIAPYLWGAIYKRSLFNVDVFKPFLFVSRQEDWCAQVVVSKRITKVCFLENIVIAYMINEKSIMQTSVTGFDYADRIQKVVLSQLDDASDYFRNLIITNRIIEYIKCFFIPEVSFSIRHYKLIKEYLSSQGNYQIVASLIDIKFIRFIFCCPLFFLYSRIYCLLFKIIKLKGKKRIVLS